MQRRTVSVAVVFALGASLVALPAQAHRAYNVRGEVIAVQDGDTFEVDLDPGEVCVGSESSGSETANPNQCRIRMLGAQAMEVGKNGDPSECNADAAENRLEQLIPVGSRVRLRADHDHTKSEIGDNRKLAWVERTSGTPIPDVALVMVQEGYALPYANFKEPARNETYMAAGDQAIANGTGPLWDATPCSPGPDDDNPIEMWVNWDAESNDNQNLNDEWIRIRNLGDDPLELDDWEVRDTSLNRYGCDNPANCEGRFPSNAVIPAGGYVRIFVGSGSDDVAAGKYYMDRNKAIFENESDDPTYPVGEGVYLLDPDGDIRARFSYAVPCVVTVLQPCTDPNTDRLRITAHYDVENTRPENSKPIGEWINIENVSNVRVNLKDDYVLDFDPTSYLYPFFGKSYIDPGERMRVYVGEGSKKRLKRHWGKNTSILNNGCSPTCETVRLRTHDNVIVGTFAWAPSCETNGSPCPRGPKGLKIVKVDRDEGSAGANGEKVIVRNDTSKTVNLRDWMIESRPQQLDISKNRKLKPGEKAKIFIGKGRDRRTSYGWRIHWDLAVPILAAGGDAVSLLTPYRTVRQCRSWGSGSC